MIINLKVNLLQNGFKKGKSLRKKQFSLWGPVKCPHKVKISRGIFSQLLTVLNVTNPPPNDHNHQSESTREWLKKKKIQFPLWGPVKCPHNVKILRAFFSQLLNVLNATKPPPIMENQNMVTLLLL